MMHGEMWWMPLMMWGPLLVLLALAAAVGYLWARRDPAASTASQPGAEAERVPAGGPSPSASDPPASLSGNERVLYELVAEAEDDVLQKDLPEQTGMSKASVSRALDRLERRGLVQRVSHGMTNKVVLGERGRG